MSYEIPQQLEYEEKIMLGLTMKQLAYAFLFGSLALIVFFKTSLDFYVKVVAVSILVVLAILFMFLDFATFLKNFGRWLEFRKVSKGSAKLQKFIPVHEIKEDVIHARYKNRRH